jgi:uncharacterized protein YbaP (TraB family)
MSATLIVLAKLFAHTYGNGMQQQIFLLGKTHFLPATIIVVAKKTLVMPTTLNKTLDMSATLIVAKNTSFVSDIYCCCKTFNG